MEGSTKKTFLVVLIFSSFLVIYLLLLISIFSIFYLKNNPTPSSPNSSETYQLAEYDLHHSRTEYSIVSLNRRLEHDDYISYSNEANGHYTVISRFGEDEYRCTGSCDCGEDRRSSAVLTRTFSLIISAFSASMAIKIAGEAFQEECKKQFPGLCREEEIPAGADCEQIRELQREMYRKKKEQDDKKREPKPKLPGDWREYYCSARCQQNPYVEEDEVYNCEVIKTKGVVKYFQPPEFPLDSAEANRMGRKKFASEILNPYCKQMSRICNWKARPFCREKDLKKRSQCVGYRRDNDNKHIFCLGLNPDVEQYGIL